MQRNALLLLIIIASLACNLTTTEISLTESPSETASVSQQAMITPESEIFVPTLLPAASVLPTSIQVTTVPTIGTLCQAYTTYSGTDPRNLLSLRSAPSSTASQVFRVPNNAQVLLIPNTQEVEAEGYHWLNVIYVQSSQMRYQGWMARDSYAVNGVRDPSIATLRSAGTQATC